MATSILKSIRHRQILNSHADFTTEFQVELGDGRQGLGASPKGETISIYEDQNRPVSPATILAQMEEDGCFGRPFDQEGFDAYLATRLDRFGRNNAFSLSLAFFQASEAYDVREAFPAPGDRPLRPPRLCLNILNGGWHAYTNPVLSDFSEFMLVARETDPQFVIPSHQAIQRVVKERLRPVRTRLVSGNPVHVLPGGDNRSVIEFLRSVLAFLGLEDAFELMIDASASDLWREGSYRLMLTDGSSRSSDDFRSYWEGLIRDYGLAYLEDPFAEHDLATWRALASASSGCRIIGDNLYASEADRIEAGVRDGLTHGVIVKPNQAGSVTAVRRAIETARRLGQVAIASHRSISTEETFLAHLTCAEGLPLIKIGPLETDYSSVLRFNEILRLTSPPSR